MALSEGLMGSAGHPRVSTDLSDEALGWIVRLNSGEAGAGAQRSYEAWKAQSGAHGLAAAEAEALWGLAEHVDRNPATGLIQPVRRSPRVTRRGVLAGAVLVPLCAGTGFWGYRRIGRGFADYATGTAQLARTQLPDGSRVVLNAWSRANRMYSAHTRGIAMLEGQAFFEMRDNPAQTFEVRAGAVTVSGRGASFDVDANLPGAAIAVAATEGVVELRAASGARAVLEAGMRSVVLKTGAIAAPMPQEASVTRGWQEGLLIAQDRRLDEVVAALRPWYGGWIVLQGRDVAALRVNAVLDLADPVGSLDTLAGGLPIRRRGGSFYQYISMS